jgi:hypothetical protein
MKITIEDIAGNFVDKISIYNDLYFGAINSIYLRFIKRRIKDGKDESFCLRLRPTGDFEDMFEFKSDGDLFNMGISFEVSPRVQEVEDYACPDFYRDKNGEFYIKNIDKEKVKAENQKKTEELKEKKKLYENRTKL